MNVKLAIIPILFMLAVSCKNTTNSGINPYDDLVKNPMSAGKAMDSIHIAKLYFPESKYDFGTVNQGDSVIHEFTFYNKGEAILFITNVSSSCGCTIPKIYKDKLQPGDSSKLKVVFNTKDKIDYQEKKITLFANTFPPVTEVSVSGYVKK